MQPDPITSSVYEYLPSANREISEAQFRIRNRVYTRSISFCAPLDRAGLARSLGNQALIHESRNQIPDARSRIQESLAISTSLGMPRERGIAQGTLDRLNRANPAVPAAKRILA